MNRRVTMVLLALAAAACGREQWREADAHLNTASQDARDSGFAPMSGPHNTFGDFTSHGEVPWRVHLEAHQPYFIAAVCTSGCDTLDFTVTEPHGSPLAADTGSGGVARLLLQAPEEGDYRVTFRYGKCAVAKCRWVAQVYAKETHQ